MDVKDKVSSSNRVLAVSAGDNSLVLSTFVSPLYTRNLMLVRSGIHDHMELFKIMQ